MAGGLTVAGAGQARTLPQLHPYLLDRARRIRERAFRLGSSAYLAKREDIGRLFDKMVATRHALAREAGFENYRDYSFAAKYRFDYSPADCIRFHEAVEVAVLPAILRLRADRRRRPGVGSLIPWGLPVQPA